MTGSSAEKWGKDDREAYGGLQPIQDVHGASSDAFGLASRREATQSEIDNLRHVADRVPFAAWAVIIAGAAERFTYFGVIAPWQNHMQNPRGDPARPGILGLGQSTAVNIYNAFFLFSFLTPMLFALLSDMWLGRFKALMLGMSLYFVGCLTLVLTSLPIAIDAGAGVGGLVAALIFVGLGAGSVKATYFPLLGDQYVQRKPQWERRENGDEVIVDGPRTIQLMYNAYYWFTNVASLSSIPVTFLEFHFDFWAAYLLPTCALALSTLLFALWAPKLIKVAPEGNVMPQAAKALTCAARNSFKLDNAKASYQQAHYQRTVPWTNHFVEELKRGLIACRVIFSLLVFYLCVSQMYNNLVSQAGQMRLSGIPNDMIQSFSGVACILFGPPIQGLYSVLAKRKIPFPPIARMTTAFIFCGTAMAYAAGLQKIIYSRGPCFDHPFKCRASQGGELPNDINVWIQMPVYVLLAVGEIFGFVTAFEYAYGKSPRNMKTVVQALTQLTAGLASVLGMAISPAAKDPNMVVFYTCLAGAMGLTAGLFWWRFRKYDEIDAELNQLDHKPEELGSSEEAQDRERDGV